MGKAIGHNSYKIRLSVKSKDTGKRGGLRIISHLDIEIICMVESHEGLITVSLISIYDKKQIESISDKELKDLIKGLLDE